MRMRYPVKMFTDQKTNATRHYSTKRNASLPPSCSLSRVIVEQSLTKTAKTNQTNYSHIHLLKISDIFWHQPRVWFYINIII